MRCATTGIAALLIVGMASLSVGATQPPSEATSRPETAAVASAALTTTTAASAASAARSLPTEADEASAYTTRPNYHWPWGAMAVTLYKDGQRVLAGEVVDIGGTVYVPVQRFVRQFGSFSGTYYAATESVVYTGRNLTVSIRVGDPYITVNDRIFYTGKPVLSIGGWIFAPIEPMTRAMGSTVTVKQGWYQAYITTGDPTSVPHASAVYNEEDLYWLSRIISAESRGEPLAGRIAVGNVVMNRTRSSAYPSTVKGVIFDRRYGTQFAPADNGTIYQSPSAGSVLAAKICLEGYSLSPNIFYFFNPSVSPSNWISNNRPFIFTIGNHKFYG